MERPDIEGSELSKCLQLEITQTIPNQILDVVEGAKIYAITSLTPSNYVRDDGRYYCQDI